MPIEHEGRLPAWVPRKEAAIRFWQNEPNEKINVFNDRTIPVSCAATRLTSFLVQSAGD